MARAGSCGGKPLALRRRKAEYDGEGGMTFLDDNAANRKLALGAKERRSRTVPPDRITWRMDSFLAEAFIPTSGIGDKAGSVFPKD